MWWWMVFGTLTPSSLSLREREPFTEGAVAPRVPSPSGRGRKA
jgi:hypothetical protein